MLAGMSVKLIMRLDLVHSLLVSLDTALCSQQEKKCVASACLVHVRIKISSNELVKFFLLLAAVVVLQSTDPPEVTDPPGTSTVVVASSYPPLFVT